jgi:hypothetical protein
MLMELLHNARPLSPRHGLSPELISLPCQQTPRNIYSRVLALELDFQIRSEVRVPEQRRLERLVVHLAHLAHLVPRKMQARFCNRQSLLLWLSPWVPMSLRRLCNQFRVCNVVVIIDR